jgi:hypothetical protein
MKSKDLAGLSHSVNVDQSNRQAATQYLNEMDKEEILQGASSVTSLKECQAEAPIGFTRTGGHLMDSMNTRPLCFTPESYQEVTYCTKDPDSIYVNESLINLLGTKCTHFEQKEVRGLMVATRPQHQSQPVVVTNQLPEPEKGDDRTSGRYD